MEVLFGGDRVFDVEPGELGADVRIVVVGERLVGQSDLEKLAGFVELAVDRTGVIKGCASRACSVPIGVRQCVASRSRTLSNSKSRSRSLG